MLKLEPRELDRVVLALPEALPRSFHRCVARVDGLLRNGQYEEAVDEVDQALLEEGLGLSRSTLQRLKRARHRLVARRMGRTRRDARELEN
jgi:hypothetical protein